MLAQLASFAVTIAVILFLLSLPFGENPAGGTLRRAAAFSFILAFVPSLLLCALQPLMPHAKSATKMLELSFAAIGLIAVLIVLSFAAYGFLDLRKWMDKPLPRPADGVRFAKRPADSEPTASRDEEERR